MNTHQTDLLDLRFAKAPFPWFGGKSRAADLIWSRLGADCKNYVEPFLGSAAVWLGRPPEYAGWCTLNDLDGHVVNFWRSVRDYPDATAEAAAQPVFEADKHARHLRLVREAGTLAARLMGDTDYCEPTLAGWWAWGLAVWIGGGWCSGKGPWGMAEDAEGFPVLARMEDGTGVNRKLPHLGDGGTGVNRKLPHLGGGGTTAEKLAWVREWFGVLQDHFREARIACGGWERILSPGTMTRNGVCAVVLDPPYSTTDPVYAHDCSSVAGEVRDWCRRNGDNPRLRIALCGHDGEHNELEALGWTPETWAKSGGYQGADDRERIWFSPACIKTRETAQRDMFQEGLI